MTSLAARLEDLPGVASVTVDLDDPDRGGITVRLEAGADEAEVMERVRALLVAYGVRSASSPPVRVGGTVIDKTRRDLGVDVRITPIKGGARIEVVGRKIRSFRVVPPNPAAIAQGVADAWCQVVGKIPMEIVKVSLGDDRDLQIVASNGSAQRVGQASVTDGWLSAIARAVGEAIDLIGVVGAAPEARMTSAGW